MQNTANSQDAKGEEDCMEVSRPEDELSPLTDENMELLNQVLSQVTANSELTPQDVDSRQHVLQDLQEYIRRNFNENAQLSLFGSTVNGFGFKSSDLDISMVCENQGPEGLDFDKLVEELKQYPSMQNVKGISKARIPVIKFHHIPSGLNCDISFENTMAHRNTALLQAYSAIDPRVQALVCALKTFAKACGICDASRGSLSSYTYTLMVIYFLQQKQIPVVPVLQELYVGEKPEMMVDEWNTWFYDDIKQLQNEWPGWGANQESLAELWIGLLKFYTEEFKMDEYVISIGQDEPILRTDKQGNVWKKFFAIEDPFILSRNLGAPADSSMGAYIMDALQNCLFKFCTPIHSLPEDINTFQNHFFNPNQLTNDTEPPNRCCRICRETDHTARNCPEKQKKKQKVCWKCHETGHFARKCPKQEEEKEQKHCERSNGDEDNNSKEECEPDSLSDHCCMTCNKTGHLGEDCPEQNDEKNPNAHKNNDDATSDEVYDNNKASIRQRYCKKCNRSGHRMCMCRKWKIQKRKDRISKWYTTYLQELYREAKDAKCKTKINRCLIKENEGHFLQEIKDLSIQGNLEQSSEDNEDETLQYNEEQSLQGNVEQSSQDSDGQSLHVAAGQSVQADEMQNLQNSRQALQDNVGLSSKENEEKTYWELSDNYLDECVRARVKYTIKDSLSKRGTFEDACDYSGLSVEEKHYSMYVEKIVPNVLHFKEKSHKLIRCHLHPTKRCWPQCVILEMLEAIGIKE